MLSSITTIKYTRESSVARLPLQEIEQTDGYFTPHGGMTSCEIVSNQPYSETTKCRSNTDPWKGEEPETDSATDNGILSP